MTINPVCRILTKHKPNESVSAIGKRHQKEPTPSQLPRQGIPHHPGISKIDLALIPRFHLQTNRHRRRPELKLSPKVAFHGAIADRDPFFLLKQTPYLFGRHPGIFEQSFNPIPVRENQSLCRLVPIP
jgi:hypothetical protein